MSRVVVRVETHPLAGPPEDRTRFIALCATGACTWRSSYQHVKAAAEEQARWHRDTHRPRKDS